jgi:hypothetical protein
MILFSLIYFQVCDRKPVAFVSKNPPRRLHPGGIRGKKDNNGKRKKNSQTDPSSNTLLKTIVEKSDN